MADGSGSFNFPLPQQSRLRAGEIIVDLFAGGGASEALRQALGRDPDLAYNHDEMAIGMHAANHPMTIHHREDIWHADPRRDVAGRPVGWLHASPDCTHFSQAKGGQPRSRKTRGLSWAALKWLGQLQAADRRSGTNTAPRIFSLENVWQILTWGPLIAKRDKATGRVLKMDGTVAAKGERVPVELQQLVPDKRHAGRTWGQFVDYLLALGYEVEWRKLIASDYGAGTSRARLFLLGRRDGEAIRWPPPTHGTAAGLKPLVTAADCIDWSIPCQSIFSRKKPLADATHRRIAKGIQRYVLGAANPFIVPATHHGERRVHPSDEPLPTITAANRGELMLVAPSLVECANASANGVSAIDKPLGTISAQPKGGSEALVSAMLVQAAHGEGKPDGVKRWGTGSKSAHDPVGTITANGSGGHAVAAAHLVKFRGDSTGSAADEPMPTITSGAGAARPAGAAHAMGVAVGTMVQVGYGERDGQAPRALDVQEPLGVVTAGGIKHAAVTAFLEQANGGFYDGEGHDMRKPAPTICGTGSQQRLVTAHVECTLNPEHEAGALRVAAFLMRYYGTGGQHGQLDKPLATVTTKDRLALVTVTIQGTPYVIVDIGLRMLKPHELYRAQGFPPGYIIDRTADGRRLTTSAAVRMVGNSVSPPPLFAMALANLDAVPAPLAVAA
ncbi:DNA methyltransferase [Pseudoxanthomonas winnipegensis]|uniref:DNA (cytosine-5-)-methyltransferase n=1 Tax=Pseudoxanthomonas winnipegensis TaxID=2480810 RepID=A0A4Q8LFS6_9GAMM|nr:DNA methyltransferase [Pseudoxanthomonas winnipegensis]